MTETDALVIIATLVAIIAYRFIQTSSMTKADALVIIAMLVAMIVYKITQTFACYPG